MPVNGTVYNGATNNPGNARMPVNPVNYPAGHQGPGVVPFQPPIGTAPGTGGNPGGGGGNPGGTGSFGGFQTPGGIIGLQPGNDINPTEYGPPVTEWGQGGASGNRELAGGQAYQGYSGMVNNGGYDAATQNAITQTGENTARAGYAGAADQAARHAQATGNTAGYNSAIARLGQAESGTISDNARQNQIAFANEKQRQKEAGLQGLGGLYGGETNYLENLFGQRSGLSSTPLFKSSTTQGTGNVVGGSFNLSL